MYTVRVYIARRWRCSMAVAVPVLVLGRVVMTRGARDALAESAEAADAFLNRHRAGDWGDVAPEEAADNDRASECGCRVRSAYLTPLGHRVVITTSGDRSLTTLSLPEEF
jgi:hypothetical protein